MTDIDQALRRLSDLETQVREQGYRIKALEKAHEPRMAIYTVQKRPGWVPSVVAVEQFCECGRDLCRAPECPSHKTDPMGR